MVIKKFESFNINFPKEISSDEYTNYIKSLYSDIHSDIDSRITDFTDIEKSIILRAWKFKHNWYKSEDSLLYSGPLSKILPETANEINRLKTLYIRSIDVDLYINKIDDIVPYFLIGNLNSTTKKDNKYYIADDIYVLENYIRSL